MEGTSAGTRRWKGFRGVVQALPCIWGTRAAHFPQGRLVSGRVKEALGILAQLTGQGYGVTGKNRPGGTSLHLTCRRLVSPEMPLPHDIGELNYSPRRAAELRDAQLPFQPPSRITQHLATHGSVFLSPELSRRPEFLRAGGR